MNLKEMLIARRTTVRSRWQELILESYPENSRGFFGGRRSRFQNPVGAALERQLDALLDLLTDTSSHADEAALSEDWIKIRAVQGFAPSLALNFLPTLKLALRETLDSELLGKEMQDLDTRLDRLLLMAFDRYMEAREKLFEIRIGEWRDRSNLSWRQGAGPQSETSVCGGEAK
jgi:hypothetical protein